MNFHSGNFDSESMPKFQTTQRKPGVIEALSKLWGKIQLLEKSQNIKQTQHNLGTQTDVKGNEAILPSAEVQCKLLELQLRYLRRILAQSLSESDSVDKIVPDFTLKNTNKRLYEPTVHFPVCDGNNKGGACDTIRKNEITAGVSSAMSEQILPCSKCAFNLISDYPEKLPSTVSVEQPRVTNVKFATAQPRTRPGNSSYPRTRYLATKGSTNRHYHLNLKDIPFLLGTSTTASHSVIANVQNIIAMMKTHHSGLCTDSGNLQEQKMTTAMKDENRNVYLKDILGSNDFAHMPAALNISDLMHTLQDELDGLTLEELKLKQQLAAVQDPIQEEALYHEQNALASRVESKVQQIETLRSLLIPLKKSKKKQHRRGISADNHVAKGMPSKAFQRHRALSVKHVVARPISTIRSNLAVENKQLLQELNKLKTVLNQDDVCWT